MDIFEIPPTMRSAVKRSWAARESDMLGRFDFSWDGRGEPKLLEYNADTPTILVETAVGQQMWLDMKNGEGGEELFQFNCIHSNIVSAWQKIVPKGNRVDFMNISENVSNMDTEEKEHIRYLKNTAIEAFLRIGHMDFDNELFSDDFSAMSTDIERSGQKKAKYVWKGRPYEWLAYDTKAQHAFAEDNIEKYRWIEPPWKLILANKAILPLLWEMFPQHPNLLFSTYDRNHEIVSSALYKLVSKPKYGREGQGVVYSSRFNGADEFIGESDRASYVSKGGGASDQTESVYLGEPVFQEFHNTGRFSERKIVIGSWVIFGQPSGICVREDSSETTLDNSSFVPHYTTGNKKLSVQPLPACSTRQSELRADLYKEIQPTGARSVHSNAVGSGGGGWWGLFRGSPSQSSSATTQNPVDYENIKKNARAYHSKYHTTAKNQARNNSFKRSGETRSKYAARSRTGAGHSHVHGFGSGRG